jgi:hypothetical protein
VTENTAPEHAEPVAPEAHQPGAPTDEELAADGNLYAPAVAGDDEGVDEHGDEPAES